MKPSMSVIITPIDVTTSTTVESMLGSKEWSVVPVTTALVKTNKITDFKPVTNSNDRGSKLPQVKATAASCIKSSEINVQPNLNIRNYPLNDNQTKRNDVHYLLKQLNSFNDIEEIAIVDIRKDTIPKDRQTHDKFDSQLQSCHKKESTDNIISGMRKTEQQVVVSKLTAKKISTVAHSSKQHFTANSDVLIHSKISCLPNSANIHVGLDNRKTQLTASPPGDIGINESERIEVPAALAKTTAATRPGGEESDSASAIPSDNGKDASHRRRNSSFFKCCYTSFNIWRNRRSDSKHVVHDNSNAHGNPV